MKGVLIVAGSLLVGLLLARLMINVCRPVLEAPMLKRTNYRDRQIYTARGLVILLVTLGVESIRVAFASLGIGSKDVSELRSAVVLAVVVYGLLGLIDDCLAVGVDRGFRGHIAALMHGRLTSGMLKMIGGGAVAMLIVASPGFPAGRSIIVDGVLIAACANAGNLFDRTVPHDQGRVARFRGGCGDARSCRWPDCDCDRCGGRDAPRGGSERAMLGDTGANPLGAVIGIGIVFGASSTGRLVACLIAVAINLAAERWSFSEIIESSAVLRFLDGIGQSPQRRAWARRARDN